MLDIYAVSQIAAQDALRLATTIRTHDRNLADQLVRAASAIPLNISEGAYSRGGNRMARYHTAMGSAAETRAILELVEGAGWIARSAERHARLDQIVGTLVRVLRISPDRDVAPLDP